jgi:hypothetical protein
MRAVLSKPLRPTFHLGTRGRVTSRKVIDRSLDEAFENQKKDFAEVVDFGLRVSLRLNGEPATEQSKLASIVHTKMCVTGHRQSICLEHR